MSKKLSLVAVASLVIACSMLAATAQAKRLANYTDVIFPGGMGNCLTYDRAIACSNIEFKAAECGGSKAWQLKRTGRVRSTELCGGGSKVIRPKAGATLTFKGVTCKVLKNGVRCKNKSGHGFKITASSRSKF